MADPKKPNRKKHKETPQEKVKRSQAAKRRGRDAKGQFREGAHSSIPKAVRPGMTAGEPQQMSNDTYADLRHKLNTDKLTDAELRTLAQQVTRARLSGDTTADTPFPTSRSVYVRKAAQQEVTRLRRAGSWRSDKDLYTQPGATGDRAKRKYVSPNSFVTKELAPEHRTWLDKALQDPSSEFNAGLDPRAAKHGGAVSPGQRKRLIAYVNALQEGKSHGQALEGLRQETRGRKPSSKAARKPTTGLEPGNNRYAGRRSKEEPVAPGAREFRFGVDAAAVDSIGRLRQKLPDMGEQDLYRTQQYQRKSLADELLKNQRWTHETRRANVLGKQGKELSGLNPDRVVFFTTSIGHPAVSVPSDSLIGQYVIRRRKQFIRKEGLATSKQLQGKFPEAVRDMHVMEAATGVAFGAEGRWGVFQKTGWRRGAKKSRGYGKPAPVGQQVLYDRQGRPMYDAYGNIRYSEGGTRPFSVGTDKDLGLRIFVG